MRVSPKGKFVPIIKDHPNIGSSCYVCGDPLEEGDAPTVREPGGDESYYQENGYQRGVDFFSGAENIAHERCVYT